MQTYARQKLNTVFNSVDEVCAVRNIPTYLRRSGVLSERSTVTHYPGTQGRRTGAGRIANDGSYRSSRQSGKVSSIERCGDRPSQLIIVVDDDGNYTVAASLFLPTVHITGLATPECITTHVSAANGFDDALCERDISMLSDLGP